MIVKDLIKYLTNNNINPNATVWLTQEKETYDFTGINTDDLGDIALYPSANDRIA